MAIPTTISKILSGKGVHCACGEEGLQGIMKTTEKIHEGGKEKLLVRICNLDSSLLMYLVKTKLCTHDQLYNIF